MARKQRQKPMPLHRMTDKAPRNDDYRYQIIPRTVDMAQTTPEIDGKVMPYGRSGGCMTDDKGVADAIVAKYGKDDVEVWPVKDKWHPSDQGHRYTFQGIALPWHKYDEYGRLIRDKDNKTCDNVKSMDATEKEITKAAIDDTIEQKIEEESENSNM